MSEELPQRAFVLELKVGADTRDDLIGVLRQLEYEIGADKLTEGVSGGYSSGYSYKLTVDESMTHDRYTDELDRYMEAKGYE
jgi:hypothetical protein